jgi:hypothetical protein
MPYPLVCKHIAARTLNVVGCRLSSWTDLAGRIEYLRVFGLSEWDVIVHIQYCVACLDLRRIRLTFQAVRG